MGWLKDSSVHSYAWWKNPKSLAQVWTCSTQKQYWKPLSGIHSKYGMFEVIQAQEVDSVLLFILEYRIAILSRGMQQ